MGGFSMGMGGGGFNPSSMDAYSALLDRMPGIVDESLAMRRSNQDSKMQDAELARKQRAEAMAMEKQRIADQKKREEEMKKAAADERRIADQKERTRLQARTDRLNNMTGNLGGLPNRMDRSASATAYDELYSPGSGFNR